MTDKEDREPMTNLTAPHTQRETQAGNPTSVGAALALLPGRGVGPQLGILAVRATGGLAVGACWVVGIGAWASCVFAAVLSSRHRAWGVEWTTFLAIMAGAAIAREIIRKTSGWVARVLGRRTGRRAVRLADRQFGWRPRSQAPYDGTTDLDVWWPAFQAVDDSVRFGVEHWRGASDSREWVLVDGPEWLRDVPVQDTSGLTDAYSTVVERAHDLTTRTDDLDAVMASAAHEALAEWDAVRREERAQEARDIAAAFSRHQAL